MNIRLYSRFLRDIHLSPSCHKWSDFECGSWCVTIPVRTPHSEPASQKSKLSCKRKSHLTLPMLLIYEWILLSSLCVFGDWSNLIISCNLEYSHLEDDFLLVQARLVVPCSYVSRRVPYKYIVWKEERKASKEKEKAKYLWEYLVGRGRDKKRCLQIPEDKCGPGGA